MQENHKINLKTSKKTNQEFKKKIPMKKGVKLS